MASEATEPVTPAMATAKVSVRGPTRETIARTTADKNPLCSATATPSITVMMTPSGGKEVKLVTVSVTILEMLSWVRRLSTSTGSPLAGSVALMPIVEPIQLETATTPARMTNSQKGSGSLLPSFSTQLRNPPDPELDSELELASADASSRSRGRAVVFGVSAIVVPFL